MTRPVPILLACLLAAAPAGAGPRFEDRSGGLPVPHVYTGGWEHFVGGGVAVLDCDDDGLPDLYAAGGEAPARLFRNLGDFRFDLGDTPALTGVTGAYPLDLDADGLLDLFVMRAGPNVALRGLGGCRFETATGALGLPAGDAWTTAFTAWLEPGETRPTLAIGNYVDRADPEGPFGTCDENAILQPVPEGWRSTPLTPGYCPLSMLAARDARGRPTLRISNDRHYYVDEGREQMWDIAERRFLGARDGWSGPKLWGMGIATRDLDGDGRDEVMLTSMGDQLLQIARPDGTYAAAPYEIGTYAQRPHVGDDGRPSTGWHAEFGDVDNDGRDDLFIAKGNVDQMPGLAMRDPNNLLMQRSDGTFREAAAEAGIATTHRSRGAALADLDGDGRLDLVVVNRRAPLEIWRNVTEGPGNWLALDLRRPAPGGSDRAPPPGGTPDAPAGKTAGAPGAAALGARVTVTTDAGRQFREVTVGGGHAGGQAGPLHFGLGQADGALIEVAWPDGRTTRATVAANRRVTLSP